MHPVVGAADGHADACLLLLLLLAIAVAGALGGHLRFDATGDVRSGVFSQVILAIEACTCEIVVKCEQLEYWRYI